MLARSLHGSRVTSPASKLGLVIVGSTLIGLGISLFLHAHLGLPPYDVLVSSIARLVGLSHGQSAWLISGGLLLIASILGRRPSIYGVIFIAANGVSVDSWTGLLVDPQGLGSRILFVVLGILAVAAGISVVAHSSSTGGPFELLSAAASDRSVNPRLFRPLLELSTVAIGIGLGGSIGFATLAFVISIGPAISITAQALADQRTGREQRMAAKRSEPIGQGDLQHQQRR